MTVNKIYGAPGTGKTTRMLDLLQQEVESGTPLERIAFVTHTVAAKLEAKERIQRVMPITREAEQLRYFRTIHGICYIINGLKRENVMQPNDYLKFGDEIGVSFSNNFTSDIDIDGLPIGFAISQGNEILAARQFAAAQGKFVSEVPDEWPIWATPSLMRDVIVGYEEWKEKNAKFDFVDMLMLYDKYGEALNIDVMFIDEAQDLSKFQWQIVDKMMKKAKRVYIAGDDDQSIYAFIGSDRYGFLDHCADNIEILPVTYRLKSNVWNFAQNIIQGVEKRQSKKIEVRADGGIVDYYNGDLLYLDIEHSRSTMIIARHHKQLQDLAASLDARGIPYKGRGREIAGTTHALMIHAYFRARKGENITLREAARIYAIIGDKNTQKQLLTEARSDPSKMIGKDGMKDINWDAPWDQYLAKTSADIKKNEIIRNALNNVGLSCLTTEPSVSLMTYHASKGREADHVVLLTDCFRKAYDYGNRNPDDEKRLSYVGVTRAREHLTIIPPKTTMYMRSLR